MLFAPGERVHLAGLGTGTVIAPRGADRYAIDIKGRVVIAFSRDLQRVASRRDRKAHTKARRAGDAGASETPAVVSPTSPSLDLHGKTTSEAIELVAAFVSDALVAGHGEVRIIHGRSGGRVKAAVHKHLRQLPTVAALRLDPRNPGATIVTFA